jgi:hypothetical protein
VALKDVLDILGYSQTSPNYIRVSDAKLTSEALIVCTMIQESLPDCFIHGYYQFNTSPSDSEIATHLPSKAAVFIAEAKSDEIAAEIHKKFWNTGIAPFIIIVLPSQVLVFSGFSYYADKSLSQQAESQAIIAIPNDMEIIVSALSDFCASAIDSGQIWEKQGGKLDFEGRVDKRLLSNLKQLDLQLDKLYSMSSRTRHALIGKYVYLRYLRDRDILSNEWLEQNNIAVDAVFGRNATKDGFRNLVYALEARFNGKIFPLEIENNDEISDATVQTVARAFKGDQMQTGQMALFDPYDFRFIPVEMLASIYEQFLEGRRSKGAYYTPQPLAEYLYYEITTVKPLNAGFLVLDPACGSGTFLVTVYQKLIEMLRTQQDGADLTPDQLCTLLSHLYGVEREEDACYVTEFSLILALLSHIDPPELHKNKDFHFPILHNRQIFNCDFFEEDSPFTNSNIKFDWIIGNPPWFELKPEMDERLLRVWIAKNSKRRAVPDNRVSDAFCWRAGDFIKDDGIIGLLLPAKTLFNLKSKRFRMQFFKYSKVWRITNFSNLRRVLFSDAIAPASTFIFSKRLYKVNKFQVLGDDGLEDYRGPIIHYAPFLANQKTISPNQKEAWTLTINAAEIQTVDPDDAEKGETSTWKMAFWGSHRDERILARYRRLYPKTLGQFLKDHQSTWHLSEGLQLRRKDSKEKTDFVPELVGKPLLSITALNASNRRYSIGDASTSIVSEEEAYVRKGRTQGIVVSQSPHLLIHSSWNYVIFSDKYFIVPPRQWGLSCPRSEENYLRALSIYLSSSLVEYYLFFQTPARGIERDTLTLQDLHGIPIPDFSKRQISLLSDYQREISAHGEKLTELERSSTRFELDRKLIDILGIPEVFMMQARDFINIRYSLNDGKASSTQAVEQPTYDDISLYAQYLVHELDDFTKRKSIRHQISISMNGRFIICQIEFINTKESLAPRIERDEQYPENFWAEVWDRIGQPTGQWIYIQRELRIFEKARVFICKSARRIDWTPSQALSDSDSIIAEILGRGKKYGT